MELLKKFKLQYPDLKESDCRKVMRAVSWAMFHGKINVSSIGNFVDGNDWYDARANQRVLLAQDILEEMNLIRRD